MRPLNTEGDSIMVTYNETIEYRGVTPLRSHTMRPLNTEGDSIMVTYNETIEYRGVTPLRSLLVGPSQQDTVSGLNKVGDGVTMCRLGGRGYPLDHTHLCSVGFPLAVRANCVLLGVQLS